MRSWMLARASPATGPLGEITRGREKFTQRVGIDGDGRPTCGSATTRPRAGSWISRLIGALHASDRWGRDEW